MSEFTQDEYDIIMSEKPKADTNESYKGFLDMKLHTEDVPGTGKGKGSDDWDLGDLMKIKAEEQPKLPPGETPDMMFDTPYIKDEPLMTSSTVKTKHINSLFGPHVTFDDKKNRTYVFDEHELSNNPVAIRMREYRRRKKEGTKVKKGRPKKKGGRRKTRKMRGGDLNDIKVGSIIGSRYNDNWTHTLGRSMQKWRVVEIEKKPMDLNGIAFVRLRPVNDKGTATGPKTDIIAFWRLKGMFDIVPETKFDIQSRTASGGRKKNTRKKKRGGRPTIKDIKYGSAWVHQDTKKRYKISNPYPELEYKDGGFIVLVRDPEYDPNDKKIYKYKKSKDLFQNFALARHGWDGGGEGGGGAAASSLRRRIPREGMVIETMGEGNGRVADHEHDGVPRSTPINFNYETEIRELNRRTNQHINEINRMHKDEYGRFKPSDSPFVKHETEWARKYNEIYNRYNSQKQHLDNLNQQYSTAEVVHENMELVGAPEAPTGASVSGGGSRKKIRRRKVKCGSITVKLKYKSRN